MRLEELLEMDDHMNDMRNALSDVAMQELQKIEDDPVDYFGRVGTNISTEQAMDIQQTISAVDDKTFDLMANSPYIIQSLEDNYNDDTGEAFIDLDSLSQVLQRVKARINKNKPKKIPGEERIGYDASRPGYDDPEAYDKPPAGYR